MNDEVKLILTKLKIISEEKENGAYICDKEHSKLLLSYIEQLKNNRDKAIEFLKTEHMTYDSAWEWRQALINILKGDSDE